MTTASHSCLRCSGQGRLYAFSHVANGDCFACRGTGKVSYASPADAPARKPQPVRGADRYFQRDGETVYVRYALASDGRHVVQVGGERRDPVYSERFASIDAARSYWAAAREALLAEGYVSYVPF